MLVAAAVLAVAAPFIWWIFHNQNTTSNLSLGLRSEDRALPTTISTSAAHEDKQATREQATPADATSAMRSQIEVLVVDTTGRAVEHLGVALSQYPNQVLSNALVQHTSADGRTRFTVPPGRYLLQSLLSNDPEDVHLTAGSTKRVVLTVQPARDLSVHVVDESGQAILGAKVWMSLPGDPRLGSWVGETDDSGVFCAKTNSGTWHSYFAAAKLGYATSWTFKATLLAGPTPIVLSSEHHTIHGRVVDGTSSAAVAEASVRLGVREFISTGVTDKGERLFGPPPQSCVTDMDGRFTFEFAPSYAADLMVSCSGYANTVHAIQTSRAANLTIRIHRSATIRGTVFTARGEPAGSADVGILAASNLRLSTQTNAQGSFTLNGVPPGHLQIAASLGEMHVQEELDILPATVRTWNARLAEVTVLEGQVVGEAPSSEALAAIQLRGTQTIGQRVHLSGTTFRFAPVRKGEYRVLLLSQRDEFFGTSGWVSAPQRDVRVETQTLDKQILLRSSRPLPPGRVTIRYQDCLSTWQSWQSKGGTTVVLDGVRGRGPATIHYRNEKGTDAELASPLVTDARYQEIHVRTLREHVLCLTSIGSGDDWDTLRVVDATGQTLFERHVSMLQPGLGVPLPSNRGMAQALRAGFVVAYEPFDDEPREQSFDPSFARKATLIKVEAHGNAPADPLAVQIIDAKDVVIGEVTLKQHGSSRPAVGVAVLHEGQAYRWRTTSSPNATRHPARWSSGQLILKF